MDVRHYESFELQDAIKMVKKDLGKDAIIISTREKEMYSEELGKNCRIFEVIAAPNVSENKKIISPQIGNYLQKVQFPRITKQSEVTVVKKSVINPTLTEKILNTSAQMNLKTNPKDVLFSAPLQKTTHANPNYQNYSQSQNKNENLNERMDNEVSQVRKELYKIRKEMEVLPQINWMDQIQEVKLLLHNVMKEKFKSDIDSLNSHILDICVKLKIAGVTESIISSLTTFLATLDISKDKLPVTFEKEKEFYLTNTIQQLFRLIKISPTFKKDSSRKRFICLVGPTGVGKTTTIAKLSTKLKFTEHSNIAFISMDNYRVTGADQLRAFSKILECPFFQANDKNELLHIISKQIKSDIVFIDTPGVSFHSTENKDFFMGLSDFPLPIEFHLTLSTSMKQRDLDETVRYFNFLTFQSIIFTKLDESWAFGEILNTCAQSNIPISYFSTGQKIPEDIEVASKERIIERILKI